MNTQSKSIAEIDAFGERPDEDFLDSLWNGKIAAVRVRNLVSSMASEQISDRLLESNRIADHADVEGLRVIGLSHFQAARDAELARRYHNEARTFAGILRALASPYASPFDSAVAFLAEAWPSGCQSLELPSEGPLALFTVRIYSAGVEIEPHQDILSAESPNDVAATSLAKQFGANIYLSMPSSGGILELFDTDYSENAYKDLTSGPHVIPRSSLPEPVRIVPVVGDLMIFSSHRIHAVTASQGNIARITLSFFIGMQDKQTPLVIWA